MKMFQINRRFRTGLLACLFVMLLSRSALADVTATVQVPNGTTNFYSFVSWTLKEPGDSPLFFQIELSPGMSASDIALSMAIESDGVAGINTYAAGNVYVAEDVTGTLEGSPAEVQITWQVSLNPGPGIEPLDLPLTSRNPYKVYQLLVICIGGRDGSAVQFGEDLVLDLSLQFGKSSLREQCLVLRGDSTADALAMIDRQLKSRRMPSGVRYEGLVAGCPTFTTTAVMESISANVATGMRTDSAISVGYVYHDQQKE